MFEQSLSRRSFLALPLMVPFAVRVLSETSGEHVFQYDHILGTSLDLVVWTSDADAAGRINEAVLQEIDRLTSILNTRDPNSEICRLDRFSTQASTDLLNVLKAYQEWEGHTAGILALRPEGPGAARNVDALGKAYILDKAARAARTVTPHAEGVLLNIGGDIVTWGKPVEVAVADPVHPFDNAAPLTRMSVQDCAIATSGSYARGAHLIDGRSGQRVKSNAACTVIAGDAVTANAVATTMCIAGETVFALLNANRDIEALYIDESGEHRSPGFHALEHPVATRVSAAADWPAGYQLTMTLTLTEGASNRFRGRGGFGGRGRGGERPYVAVWIENSAGKIVRVLAFWASKARYFSELGRFYSATGRDQNRLYSVARATRSPGKYDLVWDGLDDKHNPLSTGTYRVIVETSQEHGSYAKQESTIDCSDRPATMTLAATTNFEAVTVQYGPKPKQA